MKETDNKKNTLSTAPNLITEPGTFDDHEEIQNQPTQNQEEEIEVKPSTFDNEFNNQQVSDIKIINSNINNIIGENYGPKMLNGEQAAQGHVN